MRLEFIRQFCTARMSVSIMSPIWNTERRRNGTKDWKLDELREHPVIPGIVLVAYVVVLSKVTLKDIAIKMKEVHTIAASKILFLFQSTYVLRIKKAG